MRCPGCKKNGTLRSWEGPITLMGVAIVAHGRRCESCGETLFDFDEVGRQEQVVADELIKRGIRTGIEFKFVRKLAGLRANEVADMFGVRPETVSRWERGEVEVPRTAAYALGELYVHPKLTRQRFEAFARQTGHAGLRAFVADYSMVTCTLAHGGTKRFTHGSIDVAPIDALLAELRERLA